MSKELMVPTPISLVRQNADFVAAAHSELEKVAADQAGRLRAASQLADVLVSHGFLSPKQKEARARLYTEQPTTAIRDFIDVLSSPKTEAAGKPASQKQAGLSGGSAESADDVFDRIVMGAADPMTGI